VVPSILPSSVFGADGQTTPSNKTRARILMR